MPSGAILLDELRAELALALKAARMGDQIKTRARILNALLTLERYVAGEIGQHPIESILTCANVINLAQYQKGQQ